MLFTKIGFECGSWNSNLKLNLSTAGWLENCQKSHFLAETDQNPPLQSSYKGSLVCTQIKKNLDESYYSLTIVGFV